jgi:multimeric flavodoxin WrbA
LSTVILLGSSKTQGNTHQLALALAVKTKARVINLSDYAIAPFDYEFKNAGDDFLPLIREVLRYETIILASPMYWYSPSATMKTFMDRLSDLLKVEKDLGRQLRTKISAVLATGYDEIPAACFEEIFKLTFAYLGMTYRGMLYASCQDVFSLAQHQDAIALFERDLHAA